MSRMISDSGAISCPALSGNGERGRHRRKTPTFRTWKVGIVGGGPGGLMTAYLLQKYATEPFTATIFESGPRLGGKILTKSFSRIKTKYEAGAAEFYDYSSLGDDALKELIAELGLSINPMRGSCVLFDGRVLSNLDDVSEHLGPSARAALVSFDRYARDRISPQEFYHSDEANPAVSESAATRFDSVLATIPEPLTRRYIETLIHSDLATEPRHTSIAYGLHNYLMNDPAYMHLYRIAGGNEALALELAARVRAEKHLQHTVQRIGRAGNGELTITSTHDGKTRQDPFDFVVIALPNSLIPRIDFDGPQLAKAMARHNAHHHHPAHYLRVTILFDRPFWRGTFDDSFCMLDRFGGCCLYDESSRDIGSTHSILGWLVGGAAAQEMSALSDEQLISAALDSLPASLTHGRAYFVEGQVHRWVGSVSALPGGTVPWSLDRRHQPEPIDHPNLFMVGDYLFDSTLNGVLDSADYVSSWIAGRLSDFAGVRS